MNNMYIINIIKVCVYFADDTNMFGGLTLINYHSISADHVVW